MPSKLNIRAGDRFGYYTVIAEAERSSGGRRRFSCKCDCGNIRTVTLSNLRSSPTRSCGCRARKLMKKLKTKHGKRNTRIYEVWCSMKKRCLNPNKRSYRWYGAKGVSVCEEWMDFQPFYDWAMANGYQDDLTIERKDVKGNYEPTNCIFIPIRRQNDNKTNSRYVSYNGETKTIGEWAREFGLSYAALVGRINRGWPIEKALTMPQGEAAHGGR